MTSHESMEEMRARWRDFARHDAMFYVDPSRRKWSAEEFFASGEGLAREILTSVSDVGRQRMLEVGCGLGRMLFHFADHFERVDGIDIAPEMIERATRFGLPANVHVRVGSGRDLAPYGDAEFDFVLAFLVFQHIPDRAVIATYLREIRRVLKDDGRATVQFDTRPASMLRRLAFLLPDRALPPTRRRFIRRYRRRPEEVVWLIRAAGLVVEDQRGVGTARHFILLRPGPG